MLRKGPIVFLAAAILLAGLAAWGAHRWITTQADLAAAKRVVTAPVVVASQDLEPGLKLEGKHLLTLNWPAGNLPAGHFSRVAQVEGRVIKAPVVKGELIIAGKLAQEGIAGGLSAVVPPGFRAVTVRVDEVVGVAGFVQPGDRVDVLATVAKGSAFTQDPASKVVLQDINVLTVGERFQEEQEGGKVKRRKVSVVTLQVTPEDGERLGLVSSEARILLALRNQSDHQDPPTPGVNLAALMPAPSAPAPPPPPPPPVVEDTGPKVEVIKVATRVTDTPVAAQTQASPKPAEGAGESAPARKPPCPITGPAPSRR
jgi:pilus assembly protein CpaB